MLDRSTKLLALTALAALACLGTAAGTSVATTPKIVAKCSAAIIKVGAAFVQAEAKILQKCEEADIQGKKACDQGKTAGSIAKARTKLADTITKACGGKDKNCASPDADGSQPTLKELGWPSVCPGFDGSACTDAINSCGEIDDCIACVGEASVRQAIDLYYPLARAASTGTKNIKKCQVALGKAAVGFLTSKSKALAKCWGTKVKKTANCPTDAQGDIDKARATFDKAFGKACPGVASADIVLPDKCPAVKPENRNTCGVPISDLVGVGNCVTCVTDFEAECADRISALSVGATYPPRCAGFVEDNVDGVVGGQETPLLSPPEGVLEVGEAPISTTQEQPLIVNLALEATAVEESTRRLSVEVPATLSAATRAAGTSSLIVKVAGRRGFFQLPLASSRALVGIRFPFFGGITKIPRFPFGGLTKIPLRFAIRRSGPVGSGGAARSGDVISQYVSLDLTAVGAQTPVEFVQFLPIAFLVDGFTITDDDRHLYVGSGDDLTVLARDPETGRVSLVETVPSQGVADVAVSPDGATVYAVSNRGQSALEVFSRNTTTGTLTFLERFTNDVAGVTGIAGAVGVLVSPEGRTVYVSGHQTSSVAIFQRNLSTGRLTYAGVVNLSGITGQGGAFRAAVTDDGRFLYVPNFNNALVVFARNANTGSLDPIQTIFGDTDGITGLEGGFNAELTDDPDQATLYVAGFTKGTVAVFSRNANTGLLTFRQGAQEIYRTFSVAPGIGGDLVYATTGESLAVFARDGLGRLSLQGEITNGENGVVGLLGSRDILLSHDGRHIYIGDFGGEGGITVFRVSP